MGGAAQRFYNAQKWFGIQLRNSFPSAARRDDNKKTYESPYEILYCDHENEQLEVVEENGDMLTVRLASNGKTGIIPRDFTASWDGALHGWSNLNSFISVKKGGSFWKYGNVGDFAFGIYENGQVGLIPSDRL